MKQIWKWTLAMSNVQTLYLPHDATLLTVQMQAEQPQLWALCEPSADTTARTIAIYGTGNPMPDEPGKYISTFQMLNGTLVFHAFELKGETS